MIVGRPLLIAAVHPRVCGERAEHLHKTVEELRFIPACAGNAVGVDAVVTDPPVHPRVCGERRWVVLWPS